MKKNLLFFLALINSFMSLLAATADYRVVATSIVDSNEPATKVIHTTEAGQLETLLGEDNFKVVFLTICGLVLEWHIPIFEPFLNKPLIAAKYVARIHPLGHPAFAVGEHCRGEVAGAEVRDGGRRCG